MMRVDSVDFAALLPRFMRVQEDDRAMADALSVLLSARGRRCMEMSVWEMVREMDEPVLDAVAEAFGLAWWRPDWSPSVKREMLGKAEQIRLGIGTKATLEGVLQVYFSDPSLTVEEWFDYGGKPYTFRILTSEATVQRQLQFARVVDALKRTSQSMDGIFVGFSMRGTVHVGAKGSDSRTERGEAVAYAYLPKGTVLADGIYGGFERIVMEASSVDENIADTFVEAVSDGDSTLESDAPLVISSEGAPLPATHDRRERLDAAVATWWSDIGVEQAAPSIAYAWPPPQPAPAADLLTGLSHHWALGEDSMSYASSVEGDTKKLGAIAGDASWSASGRIGGCVAGTAISGNNYNNTDWPSYPFGPNRTLSLSLWLRMDSASSTSHECGFMIGRLDTGGAAFVGFSADRKPCVFRAGPFEFVKGTTALSVGWHHFVLVGDSGTLTCYCDGAVFGTATLTSQSAYSSAEFRFGRGGNSPAGCVGLNGAVDEISVWLNRDITQNEVTALYNGGAGLPFEDWT